MRLTGGKLCLIFAVVQKKIMNKKTISDKTNEVLYTRADILVRDLFETLFGIEN